jgi:predicted transcriptional regulator YdeE
LKRPFPFVLLCILGALCCYASQANDQRRTTKDQTGSPIKQTNVPGFTVVGIAARTDNAKESTADGIIPKQWQKFFSEGMLAKIPDTTGPNLYAAYADYASDHNGEYTYVVGAAVKDGTAAPSGMVAKRVPAGQYAVFTTEIGPFAKVVPATWRRIFKLEEEGKLKRAYKTDFEIYDQRAQNPQNGQIDIYVGIK